MTKPKKAKAAPPLSLALEFSHVRQAIAGYADAICHRLDALVALLREPMERLAAQEPVNITGRLDAILAALNTHHVAWCNWTMGVKERSERQHGELLAAINRSALDLSGFVRLRESPKPPEGDTTWGWSVVTRDGSMLVLCIPCADYYPATAARFLAHAHATVRRGDSDVPCIVCGKTSAS